EQSARSVIVRREQPDHARAVRRGTGCPKDCRPGELTRRPPRTAKNLLDELLEPVDVGRIFHRPQLEAALCRRAHVTSRTRRHLGKECFLRRSEVEAGRPKITCCVRRPDEAETLERASEALSQFGLALEHFDLKPDAPSIRKRCVPDSFEKVGIGLTRDTRADTVDPIDEMP